jgi:hypothetical protein
MLFTRENHNSFTPEGDKDHDGVPETLEEVADLVERESSTLAASAEVVAKGALQIATENPSRKDSALAINERAKTLAKQITSVSRYLTMTSALALVIAQSDYSVTRYRVATETRSGGDRSYKHEDAETTLILEYLSGRRPLPYSYVREYQIAFLRKVASRDGFVVPNNIEELDESGLAAVYDEWNQRWYVEHGVDRRFASGNLRIPAPPVQYAANLGLYSGLWRVEQEAGNPKIRFEPPTPDSLVRRVETALHLSFGDRAHYDVFTNTIFLPFSLKDDKPELRDFEAEAAHGKQWEEHPVVNDLKGIKEWIFTISHAIRNLESPADAYDETQYQTPGTREYEAHHVIEPQIADELQDGGTARKSGSDSPGDEN